MRNHRTGFRNTWLKALLFAVALPILVHQAAASNEATIQQAIDALEKRNSASCTKDSSLQEPSASVCNDLFKVACEKRKRNLEANDNRLEKVTPAIEKALIGALEELGYNTKYREVIKKNGDPLLDEKLEITLRRYTEFLAKTPRATVQRHLAKYYYDETMAKAQFYRTVLARAVNEPYLKFITNAVKAGKSREQADKEYWSTQWPAEAFSYFDDCVIWGKREGDFKKCVLALIQERHQEFWDDARSNLSKKAGFAKYRSQILDLVYPKEGRDLIDSNFNWLKKTSVRRWTGPMAAEDTKRLATLDLTWRDQFVDVQSVEYEFERPIAFYKPHEKRIYISPTMVSAGEFRTLFALAHEFCHGIDFAAHQNRKLIRKVMDCLSGEASVAAEPTQLGEAFADWCATEFIAQYIREKYPSWSSSNVREAMEDIALTCSDYPDAEHPKMSDRINKILMANPNIRALLQCSPRNSPKYCSGQ